DRRRNGRGEQCRGEHPRRIRERGGQKLRQFGDDRCHERLHERGDETARGEGADHGPVARSTRQSTALPGCERALLGVVVRRGGCARSHYLTLATARDSGLVRRSRSQRARVLTPQSSTRQSIQPFTRCRLTSTWKLLPLPVPVHVKLCPTMMGGVAGQPTSRVAPF